MSTRVAHIVAERVVDRLEIVETQHEHGDFLLFAARPDERVLGAVGEERAIGQVRERIVKGLMGELLLEPLARLEVVGDAGSASDFLPTSRRSVAAVCARRSYFPPRTKPANASSSGAASSRMVQRLSGLSLGRVGSEVDAGRTGTGKMRED